MRDFQPSLVIRARVETCDYFLKEYINGQLLGVNPCAAAPLPIPCSPQLDFFVFVDLVCPVSFQYMTCATLNDQKRLRTTSKAQATTRAVVQWLSHICAFPFPLPTKSIAWDGS